MIGKQWKGRPQVLEGPMVWSECMWGMLQSHEEPARYRLRKSTVMGVWEIRTLFMVAGLESPMGS